MARFLRTETNSSGGHSRLGQPLVLSVVFPPIAFRGPGVKLAEPLSANAINRRGTHYRLGPPLVVTPVAAFVARPTLVTLAYSKRGKAKSSLPRLLVVSGPTPPFDPIQVKLAPSKRGKAKWFLRAPVVVGAAVLQRPALVHLASSRRGTPKSHLSPPAVVTPIQTAVFSGPHTTLARASRRKVVYDLAPPVVVAPDTFDPCASVTDNFTRADEDPIGNIWEGTQIGGAVEARIVSNQFSAQNEDDGTSQLKQTFNANGSWQIQATVGPSSSSSGVEAQLGSVTSGGTFGAYIEVRNQGGISGVTLFVPGNATNPFAERPFAAGDSFALIVTPDPLTNIGTYRVLHKPASGEWQTIILAFDLTPYDWADGNVYHPFLKVIDGITFSSFSFCPYTNDGVATMRATQSRGVPKSRLRPVVVIAPFVAAPISIELAPSSRGRPQYRLGQPRVVLVAPTHYGPAVRLAPQPIQGRRTHPRLAPPAVVNPFVAATFAGPSVTLARIRPRRTIARLLSVPAAFGPIGFQISVTLAPSERGTPKSRLLPPSVVRTAVELSGPEVALVRIRPRRTLAVLRKPAVVGGGIAFSGPRIRLTNPLDRVPATLSRLRPSVVTVAAQTFSGLFVSLAYSRRGTPKSRLEPPTVVAPVLAREINVALAYSLRGKVTPELRPPVVVQEFRIPVVSVALAPSSRGIPKSLLRRPTDLVDDADLGSVRVTLAYSLRGKPKSILRRPVVVAPVLAPPIATTLAPQKRGTPKSRLSPPTVVFPFFARPLDITLARIRPVPTRWLLGKPTDLVDQQDVGVLRVHLAYSLRGTPKSHLEPPAVVAPVLARPVVTKLVRIRPVATRWALKPPTVVRLAVELSGPEVTLVRIRPPRTMSLLREPVAGAAQPKAERTLSVTLTYSRRGKPKSILRAPRVIDLRPQTRFLSVTLAPSRRPIAKSKLARVIVPRFVAPPPVAVTLTRIRPRRTTVLYTGVVYDGRVYAPLSVTLAPSSRLARTPHSRLYAPTIVSEFFTPPTLVVLAPQARRPGEAVLSPPAVVAVERFFGPTVVLAPSSRGRTIVVKIAPDGRATPPCYGVATGSTAPSAENALETEAGATTTSTIAAAAETASSTAAASTIEGTTAPGAENDISDAQREGC